MDRIVAVFGEAILAPVRGISDRMLEHYVFRQYNSTATIPIEVQVCQALEQQKLISVAYPRSEFRIWTDICQILFCQAFLYEYGRNLWLFDMWEIRNPTAIETCWKNLRTYKVQDFFRRQWSFLEELAPPDESVRRRELLLRTSLSNGLKTFNQGNQSADKAVQRRELLLRALLSNRSGTFNEGNQSAEMKKYYSHYNNELELLLELLSPENLIIKESWSKIPPSDFNIIVQRRSSALQEMLSDILLNSNITIPNISCCSNFRVQRYSDDGRTRYYHSYQMEDKDPSVIRAEATLKERTEIDFQYLWPIWHFQEPLIYYLDLLQCIDESSLFMLLEDLLSDFARPRAYYQENSKNVDLYPWRWGMPDIVAYDKENNFHVLLECKGPKNRLIKTQIRWLSRNLERYKLNVGLVVVNENQVGKL